jgi:signal transduction histidine kinase
MLVTNLLSNGIKYTRPNSDRHIRVSFEESGAGPTYCVSDNGIGFDPEDAERLFQAFTRLDGARATDGVGLGLTIAARAAERHDGRIWAISEKGKGASFYFTLSPVDEPASA